MLNKDLFDPKDLEIAKLKRAISDFKEYDKERKAYYSESMVRLGELESLVEELKESEPVVVKNLKKKVENQKVYIDKLLTIIENSKISKEDQDKVMSMPIVSNPTLRKQNRELRERIKKQKEMINKLVFELNKKEEE